MSRSPRGRSTMLSGSVNAPLKVSAIGLDPEQSCARHWFIARTNIGDPMALKLAFLMAQLVGAGANLSGTMIRCFHEHEPVWLLNAYWPRSAPPVSMLWSLQFARELSVLPAWAG